MSVFYARPDTIRQAIRLTELEVNRAEGHSRVKATARLHVLRAVLQISEAR